MDQITTVLNVALAVAAITAVGGVGWLRGTITNLRGQLGDSDREIAKLKERDVEKTAKIEQQASDLAALQRVVTGEKYLLSIEDLVKKHNATAREHWRREEEMFTELVRKLDRLIAGQKP